MLQDLANKTLKVAAASCAKILHRVRAKHSVALELRFGEKLVRGALVREGFVPFEVFVNVARFIAITRRLDVNDDPVRSGRTIDRRIADSTNRTVVPRIFERADFRTRINAHVIELDWDSKIDPNLAHGLT